MKVTAGVWANIDIKNDLGETCLYLEDIWVEADYQVQGGQVEAISALRVRFEEPGPSHRLVSAPGWLESQLLRTLMGPSREVELLHARLDEKALEESYATED